MKNDLRLSRSEKKFAMLFENSPIGMAMAVFATGQFIEVNPSLLASTGYTREEFLKLSYWEITPSEYEPLAHQQIVDLNETGKFGPNFKEYIRKDGTRYPIKISGFKLIDVDGTAVVWALIEDISERVALENELRTIAAKDPLTGLANRRGLEEKLAAIIAFSKRHGKHFAYLTLDLDRFKAINDAYGHVFGDEVLVEVAHKLRRVVRRRTDVVARTGGDEFTIILTDMAPLSSNHLDAIQAIITAPFEIDGQKLHVQASLGVAIYPQDGTTYDALYRVSDDLSYKAKQLGGNQYQLRKHP